MSKHLGMTCLSRVTALLGAGTAVIATIVVPVQAHAAKSPELPASIVVSAHRGGAAYAPEDTMYAYRNAVRIGADQLETDSTLTADGVLVLIHDPTLDRTTNCTGSVSSYTFAELRECDAGWWWTPGQSTTSPDDAAPHPLRGLGVRVPAAQELFDYVNSLGPKDRHTINIEIKDPAFVEPAKALVAIIEASGLKDRTIVQSFYPPALDYVKSLDSSITTALLTEGTTTPYIAYAAAAGHDWVSPGSTNPDLTAQTVSAAHAAGQKVIPWTPDSRDDLAAAGRTGVDGLITNYPACLLALEGKQYPKNVLPKASIRAGADGVPVCPDDELSRSAR